MKNVVHTFIVYTTVLFTYIFPFFLFFVAFALLLLVVYYMDSSSVYFIHFIEDYIDVAHVYYSKYMRKIFHTCIDWYFKSFYLCFIFQTIPIYLCNTYTQLASVVIENVLFSFCDFWSVNYSKNLLHYWFYHGFWDENLISSANSKTFKSILSNLSSANYESVNVHHFYNWFKWKAYLICSSLLNKWKWNTLWLIRNFQSSH